MNAHTRHRPLLLLALSLMVSCGEPAVDGRWPGEALFTLSGTVRLEPERIATPEPPSGTLRVGIFWAATKGATLSLEAAIEQEVAATATFPARFEVRIYVPPPPTLLHGSEDGEGRIARALVLAYLDQDADRAWDRDREPLVGGAAGVMLVYSPEGLSGADFGPLTAGYHAIRMGGGGGCGGPPLLAEDLSEIDLTVTMDFPSSALIDLDCDGKPDEWSSVCPSPSTIRDACRSGLPGDTMCATCEPYLWPIDADDQTCELWFDKCLYSFAPQDCESERSVCLGVTPVAPNPTEPPCTSLECVCKRVYVDCVDTSGDETSCMATYQRCVED